MWECLVTLSTWAESNSGQIQIMIGVIALGFAYKAYKKVLEQIEISNKQTDISIKQNGIDAKLATLNLLNENIKNNIDMLKQVPLLVGELEIIKKQLEEKGEKEKAEIVMNNIVMLTNQENTISKSKNELAAMTEKFSNISHSNEEEWNEYLKILYENLIGSTNSLGDYHMLIHSIEKIKIEENLK
ncbi:hypothetical protein NI470_05370 [Acinetobacter lwoffii]|uniref:hypothetical protein n=1 Tax=Acinetobacter lwoffii TaxID=28090 RepID=UPI00129864FB|nr:hypothetical protein [Acinetobacter lwoffii]MCO8073145.1 hypothetical protein [Acinetobacter lwoffii]MCO8076040.1 hypothetical protein [Acinetobacter lwoffii]MRA02521.1 hypothetical protein [Acinetobacter lwoffii]